MPPKTQIFGTGDKWPGHLQWHGEMHRKLGGSTLHFWFLRISGIYEKEKIFQKLLKCMEEVDAVAYAGYELTGEFDVMLRIWLHPSAVGKFDGMLKEKLRLTTSRNYSVIETTRHWVWEEGNNGAGPGIAACEIDSLDAGSLLRDIERLNKISDASRESSMIETKLAKDSSLLERFIDAKAIIPVNKESGIRLVLRLQPGHDVNDEDLIRINEGVTRELDEVRETIERSPAQRSSALRIREFSLYLCADNTIIVLCRIDYRAWHLFREQLLSRLGKIPGLAQSTTFPVLSPNLEISRERLVVDHEVRRSLPEPELSERIARRIPPRFTPERYKPKEEPLDPTELPRPPSKPLAANRFFNHEESTTFEAKGSAFSPLDDWLDRAAGGSDDEGLSEEKGFFRSTIAKTIVAMLNTEGGVILIGVLEAERYAQDSRDRVRLRLDGFPREGRFCLLGLQDPIYRRRRWDGFDRKFQEMLKPMIDGTIGRRVQLSPGWHDGREFAIVQVRGPSRARRHRPFYLNDPDPHFYIRRGGRNERLGGLEVHAYLEDDWEPLDDEDKG